MFQCNKVVYTVEFSVFPVIWVFYGLNSGRSFIYCGASELWTREILHCSRQAKEKSSVLSHSADSIVYTCSWFTGNSYVNRVVRKTLNSTFASSVKTVCLWKWTGIDLILPRVYLSSSSILPYSFCFCQRILGRKKNIKAFYC